MNRWTVMALFSVLPAATVAVAPARAAPPPRIKFELTGDHVVTPTLTGIASADVCALTEEALGACTPSTCFAASDAFALLGAASTPSGIWCKTAPPAGAAAAAAATQVPVSVTYAKLTPSVPAVQDPARPDHLLWLGWVGRQFNAAANVVLGGGDVACSFSGAKPGDCRLFWTRQNDGYRVEFALPLGSKPPNSITLSVKSKKQGVPDPTVEIPVRTCAFSVAHPTQLYRAFNRQELTLKAGESSCAAMLHPGDLVTLSTDTGAPVIGRVKGAANAAGTATSQGEVTLDITTIPGTLAPKSTDFSLRRGGDYVGQAQIQVSDATCDVSRATPSGPATLSVSFGQIPTLDQWHDGKSDGIALVSMVNDDVANPSDELPEIENVAHVEMPAEFTARSTGDDNVIWSITTRTWTDTVWFYDYGKKEWLDASEPVLTDAMSEIGFAVTAARATPLDVTVERVRCESFGTSPDDKRKTCKNPEVLLSRDLRLAEQARVESLPLPLASALEVVCGDPREVGEQQWARGHEPKGVDVALDGTIRAVENADVETGLCRLHYDPKEGLTDLWKAFQIPRRANAARYRTAALRFFGRQEVEVTVRRGDKATQSIIWSLDTTIHQSIVLPNPAGEKEVGIYQVEARLLGPQSPDVVYRSQPAQSGTRPARKTSGLEFHAGLRPRGNQGWRAAPIRTFVTFPVDFVGYRFPANPRELRSSQSATAVQAIDARAGVLLGLEPWNYDTGKNPWAIPTRFLTGLHIVDLSRGGLAPSLVTGVALTLPVVDPPKGAAEDQLGTDVALGFFWEVDLNEQHPLKDGNHFVVTLGVNILSLFGGR